MTLSTQHIDASKVEEAFPGKITGQTKQKLPPGSKKPLGGKAEVRTDLVHAPGYGKVTQSQYDDLKKRGVIENVSNAEVWEALIHPVRAIHVAAHKDGGHSVTIKKRDGVPPVSKHFTGNDSYEKAMNHAHAVSKATDDEVMVHDLTEEIEVSLDESLVSKITEVFVRDHLNGGSSVVIGVDGDEHIVKTHGTPEEARFHASELQEYYKLMTTNIQESARVSKAKTILESLRRIR